MDGMEDGFLLIGFSKYEGVMGWEGVRLEDQ